MPSLTRTRRTPILALLVALLTLTVSFAGWRAQAGRWSFGKHAAATAKVSAVPVAPPMFATLTVINANDSGAGSLRDTIAAAMAGDTITFAGSVTSPILLSGGQITIDKNLTITGPGANLLTVQNTASNNNVFLVSNGATASLSGLTISGGNGSSFGGIQIFSGRTLTVDSSTISGNTAFSPIVNYGTLTVTNSTISGNSAVRGGGPSLLSD